MPGRHPLGRSELTEETLRLGSLQGAEHVPSAPGEARGEERSKTTKPKNQMESRNTGSTPRPDKSGRGSTVDTGDRSSRGEDSQGRPTRSGSKSNAKK